MECGRKLPFTDGKAFSGPATDEGETGPSLPTVVCRPLLRNVFLLVLFSIDKHCGSMSFPLLFSGRKRTDVFRISYYEHNFNFSKRNFNKSFLHLQ